MLKGRPPVRVEMRRRFWRQVGLGASTAVAAAAAGVSEQTGGRWFVEAGGVPPIKLAEPSGRYLSFVGGGVVRRGWPAHTARGGGPGGACRGWGGGGGRGGAVGWGFLAPGLPRGH